MKRVVLALAGVVCLHAQPDVVGDWQGTLQAGGASYRLVVHIVKNEAGLVGTLDSLDQGALGLKTRGRPFGWRNATLRALSGRGAIRGSLARGSGGVPRQLESERRGFSAVLQTSPQARFGAANPRTRRVRAGFRATHDRGAHDARSGEDRCGARGGELSARPRCPKILVDRARAAGAYS
jgi:hypothetical protein